MARSRSSRRSTPKPAAGPPPPAGAWEIGFDGREGWEDEEGPDFLDGLDESSFAQVRLVRPLTPAGAVEQPFSIVPSSERFAIHGYRIDLDAPQLGLLAPAWAPPPIPDTRVIWVLTGVEGQHRRVPRAALLQALRQVEAPLTQAGGKLLLEPRVLQAVLGEAGSGLVTARGANPATACYALFPEELPELLDYAASAPASLSVRAPIHWPSDPLARAAVSMQGSEEDGHHIDWHGEVLIGTTHGMGRIGNWSAFLLGLGPQAWDVADDIDGPLAELVSKLGWGPGKTTRPQAFRRGDEIAYIDEVILEPQFRGRGLGLSALTAITATIGGGARAALLLPAPVTTRDGDRADRTEMSSAGWAAGKARLHAHWRRAGYRPLPGLEEYLVWDYTKGRPRAINSYDRRGLRALAEQAAIASGEMLASLRAELDLDAYPMPKGLPPLGSFV